MRSQSQSPRADIENLSQIENFDILQKENPDEQFDKHSRFNFRKLNIPPLNKDHSRAADVSLREGQSHIRNLIGSSATASQYRNKTLSVEKQLEPISPMGSNKSERQHSCENTGRANQIGTPVNQLNIISQDMSQLEKEQYTPRGIQSSMSGGNNYESQVSIPTDQSKNPLLASIDQRRARRKQLNLRENLSPQQLQMNADFLNGIGSDFDHKTSGRWSREEHEKFIEAMHLFGRDWKKVEQHIGTRSGAQIRSHAQKFFNRIEKELGADVETYITEKAKIIFERKRNTAQGIIVSDLTKEKGREFEDTVQPQSDFEQSNIHENDGDNENSHPPILESPRKQNNFLEINPPRIGRERSSSHTFGDILASSIKQSYETKINDAQSIQSLRNSSNKPTANNSKTKYHPSKFGLKKNKSKKSKPKQIYAFSPQIQPQVIEKDIKNNNLQQVIKESFNNYSNPQENSPDNLRDNEYNSLDEFFFSFERERRLIYNQVLLEFNDSMSSPQKIQIYLELFQSLHNKVVETYTNELIKDNQMNMPTRQRFLALILELTNNNQLIQQIQSFQALSLQIEHKILQNQIQQTAQQKPKHSLSDLNFNISHKNNVLSAGTLTPTSINNHHLLNNMFGGFSHAYTQNPGLNNLALELLTLLQNNQRASTTLNSRKISNDWFDKSHHSHDHHGTNMLHGNISLNSNNNNERSFNNLFGQNILNSLNDAYLSDASKKRDIKLTEKIQDFQKKPPTQQNQHNFLSHISAALGANQAQNINNSYNNSGSYQNQSSFKPKNESEFAINSLKRLRGLSQNNEQQLHNESKISPERLQLKQSLQSSFVNTQANQALNSTGTNNTDVHSTLNSLFQLLGHPNESQEQKLSNILSNMGSANLQSHFPNATSSTQNTTLLGSAFNFNNNSNQNLQDKNNNSSNI